MNHTFFTRKVQEINALPDGTIKRSTDTLFTIFTGENLYELHPFFESLREELQEGGRNYLVFPCITLDFEDYSFVCDITIKRERNFLAILFFDYSAHYKKIQENVQFHNSSLLQKHQNNTRDHKKAYLEYMNNRLDSQVLDELETIALALDTLKNTTLTNEQATLLETVEARFGNLHHKALQIKEGMDID